MAHIVARAELAVGHVQEVGVANQFTQERPGLDVNLVVGDVAVVGLAMDRHGPVGADGDAEEQLFQVGAVIFVVAEGNARRSVALLGWLLVVIDPGEGHGRGVVVHLLQANVELAHGADHKGGEQRGPVGAVEAIEGAAEAVVA